jgi:hypothetical protein
MKDQGGARVMYNFHLVQLECSVGDQSEYNFHPVQPEHSVGDRSEYNFYVSVGI